MIKLDNAGLVKWYNNSFPNCGREFDSPIPHNRHMKLKDNYAIVMIGKTHTGKTTFAQDIVKRLNTFEILEADAVSLFLNANFPLLREIDKSKHGVWETPTLKLLLFQDIVKYAFVNNLNVILANSNLSTKVRSENLF